MRKKLYKIAQAAILGIAMVFTFSCSSDDDKGDGGGGGGGVDKGNDIKNYKTIEIGGRTWMAENLNYAVEGSKCYDEQESNCNKYGRLYDWKTANEVCPSGWSLPLYSDWENLANYVQSAKGCTGCDAKHLKAKSGWNGLDSYGFSALPGGFYIYGSGGNGFNGAGNDGSWWTYNGLGGNSRSYYAWGMSNADKSDDKASFGQSSLFSVRCVKLLE